MTLRDVLEWFGVLIAAAVIFAVAYILVSYGLAHARQIDQIQFTPAQQEYIKGLHNQHSIPCCDDADGTGEFDWDYAPTGTTFYGAPVPYIVHWHGETVAVPDYTVITPNLLKEPRLWIVDARASGGSLYVRCFLPGAGI
jgi:hypothetical protein